MLCDGMDLVGGHQMLMVEVLQESHNTLVLILQTVPLSASLEEGVRHVQLPKPGNNSEVV